MSLAHVGIALIRKLETTLQTLPASTLLMEVVGKCQDRRVLSIHCDSAVELRLSAAMAALPTELSRQPWRMLLRTDMEFVLLKCVLEVALRYQ